MRRLIRYAIVSGLGVGVQLGVLWILSVLGLPTPLATGVAVSVAVAHNFAWHRYWTWQDRDLLGTRAWIAFGQFTGTAGLVSLIGNVAMVSTIVGWLAVPTFLAGVAAISLTGAINFGLAWAVFRTTEGQAREAIRERPRSLFVNSANERSAASKAYRHE